MGAGKTAVSRELKKELDRCVFLDGDWCWDSDPFQVTEETKEMVMTNICFLLNRFIHCSAYDSIVFCWVMHEQAIIDSIAGALDTEGCEITGISLVCGENTLRERLQKDIDAGIRTPDILERSVARLPLYQKLDTVRISTDGKSVREIAETIRKL